MSDNGTSHPRVRLWVADEGQVLTSDRAGGGFCVAIVRKGPTRAGDAACEDAGGLVSWSETTCALMVADGVGGHSDGAVASRITIEAIAAQLRGVTSDGLAIQAAVMTGIEAANGQLIERPGGAATTILVAVIDRGELRSYHAGDSDLLVVGQRGKIKHQTISHSPVGYAVEAGVLDVREGMAHEDRHIISNCVGMSGMRVEVASAIRLAERDTVVLASDGLWDNLHVAEVTEIVRKGPLERAVRQLASRCQDRMLGGDAEVAGKADDLTIVLYRPL